MTTQEEIALQTDAQQPAIPEMEPIPVRVVNQDSDKAAQGNYVTVIVPASTATIPGVAQLLPRDPRRISAYVMPVDYPIVISTIEQECQSVANVGATFPNGGYIGSGFSPRIDHHEAVWACNTSTAGTCRVVVMMDRAV